MDSTLQQFQRRRSLISNMNYAEASSRISGFLEWINSIDVIANIVYKTFDLDKAAKLLEHSDFHTPPKASSPEDIAVVGYFFMHEAASGKNIALLSMNHGIHPPYRTQSLQEYFDEVVRRYIEPTLDYIEEEINKCIETPVTKDIALEYPNMIVTDVDNYLAEIQGSLHRFQQDHNNHKTAFIMMQFGTTSAHTSIVKSIRDTLLKHNIVALRADDKQYHNNLLRNVLTYIHGCNIGIAVFERIEADTFNPNVSFEVGYMRALSKQVCLLKDQTMKTLPTDLLGELYKSFDPLNAETSIPTELEKWLRDKDIINTH